MKKIISFFAASALALGLIGCSGDLHENDILPLAIVGMTADAGNHVIPMTLDKPDGSEQSLKITLKDGFELTGANGIKYKIKDDPTDSWRSAGESITSLHFKVIPGVNVKADGSPDWTMDFASLNKEDPQYITAGEDYQKVGKRGDANVSGDPKHLIFDGCIAGETYVLRAKYNAAAGTLSLKLDGASSDPSAIKFVIDGTSENFPASKTLDDGTKKELTYTFSKAGTKYTYDFVATATETVSFTLKNDLAGVLGGTLPKVTYTKDGDNRKVSNAATLNLNEDTATKMTLPVTKNVAYKITVDTSKGMNKATIYYDVVDILDNATIKANFKYADAASAYTEKLSASTQYSADTNGSIKDFVATYQFFAETTEFNMVVVRSNGDVLAKDSVGTIKPTDTDAVDMKLVLAKDAADATPIKVTGLKVGTCYKFTVSANNAEAKATVKIEVVPLADLTGKKFKGAFDGWDAAHGWAGFDLTKQADGNWTVDFTVTEAQADTYEFGIYGEGDDKWCNGETVSADGNYHSIGYAGSNCKISNVKTGKTYTFTVKPGYGKIEAKIEEKK